MPTKPSYRPGYAARRMLHHSRVDFAVWLNNRKVEKAFYDPYLEVGKSSRMAVLGSKPYMPWIMGAVALLLATAAVVIGLRFRPEVSALKDVPAAAPMAVAEPTASVAAPVASAEKPAATAEKPAAPVAAPETPSSPESPAAASIPAAPAPKVWSLPETYDLLLACKKDRTLYVYHRENKQWKKVAAFNMAYGRRAGDKADAGDLRTPQGRYWITGVHYGPLKGPLYGSLVYTLNYPTAADEADGKTGQGIWIHGVEAGKLPTYTHGCLSLANDDMVALSAYADAGTPVVILADSLLPDPARQVDEAGMKREYPALMASIMATHPDPDARAKAVAQAKTFVAKESRDFPALAQETLAPAERDAIMARLEKWRAAWCGRDVESYGANYSADFRDKEGRGRQAYLDRKSKIFASKQRIDMKMEKPELEAEGYGRVKVSFRQEYEAEGPDGLHRSSDMKTLRLEDGPGGWLIVSE